MFKYICVRMNMENETKQTKAYICTLFIFCKCSRRIFCTVFPSKILPAILPGKNVRKMRAKSKKTSFLSTSPSYGGGSYWHQPNFFEIGLVDKRPFFLRFVRIFRTFLPGRIAGKILLGKNVQKMRQLHIQKINKVWICFGLFCSILHIHSNAYTCIDLYVY